MKLDSQRKPTTVSFFFYLAIFSLRLENFPNICVKNTCFVLSTRYFGRELTITNRFWTKYYKIAYINNNNKLLKEGSDI